MCPVGGFGSTFGIGIFFVIGNLGAMHGALKQSRKLHNENDFLGVHFLESKFELVVFKDKRRWHQKENALE